jgi:hypothetical protein
MIWLLVGFVLGWFAHRALLWFILGPQARAIAKALEKMKVEVEQSDKQLNK